MNKTRLPTVSQRDSLGNMPKININPKHASPEISILVKKFVRFQENNSCSNTNISNASIEIYFVTAEATKTKPIIILNIIKPIFLKSITN